MDSSWVFCELTFCSRENAGMFSKSELRLRDRDNVVLCLRKKTVTMLVSCLFGSHEML